MRNRRSSTTTDVFDCSPGTSRAHDTSSAGRDQPHQLDREIRVDQRVVPERGTGVGVELAQREVGMALEERGGLAARAQAHEHLVAVVRPHPRLDPQERRPRGAEDVHVDHLNPVDRTRASRVPALPGQELDEGLGQDVRCYHRWSTSSNQKKKWGPSVRR